MRENRAGAPLHVHVYHIPTAQVAISNDTNSHENANSYEEGANWNDNRRVQLRENRAGAPLHFHVYRIPTAQAAISNDTNSYEVTNSNENANEANIGQ